LRAAPLFGNIPPDPTSSSSYLDVAQLLATKNLYQSLLLNSQNLQALQNLQNLQQLQAASSLGYGLSGIQQLQSNASSGLAASSGFPLFGSGSGGAGASIGAAGGLCPATLAAIAALQGRGQLPSPSPLGSAEGGAERPGAGGSSLERLQALSCAAAAAAAGAGAGAASPGLAGGLQLPPMQGLGQQATQAGGMDPALASLLSQALASADSGGGAGGGGGGGSWPGLAALSASVHGHATHAPGPEPAAGARAPSDGRGWHAGWPGMIGDG
jgi:hypothetical protein